MKVLKNVSPSPCTSSFYIAQFEAKTTLTVLLTAVSIICAQKNDLGGGGGADALKIVESNFISSINCRLTQVRATGTDIPVLRRINYRLVLQGRKYFY